jgi:hypothetical protein
MSVGARVACPDLPPRHENCPRRRRDGQSEVKAEVDEKAMDRSSPDPVDTSRTGALSALRPFQPRLVAAAMGVPIDLNVLQDDHRAGKQCHPENLGSDGI